MCAVGLALDLMGGHVWLILMVFDVAVPGTGTIQVGSAFAPAWMI